MWLLKKPKGKSVPWPPHLPVTMAAAMAFYLTARILLLARCTLFWIGRQHHNIHRRVINPFIFQIHF